MNVRLLGALLLFALVAAPAAAQNSPTATARPPAQPPVPEPSSPPSPIPQVIKDTDSVTTVITEPVDKDKAAKSDDVPAAVKSLWRYGDGGEYLLWYIKNSRVPPLVLGTNG